MADDKMEITVRDPKPVAQALKKAMTAENFQKYILGTKKNGAPRAVYDIIKDVAISESASRSSTRRKTVTSIEVMSQLKLIFGW